MTDRPAVEQQETPFAEKQKVRTMFNRIAPSYDLLNTLLSAGIHKVWKRKVIRTIRAYEPREVLDLATGTGDLALLAAGKNGIRVTAIDISENMLGLAQAKALKKGLQQQIRFMQADGTDLPFEASAFDAATIGFGIRNFEEPLQGLKEICRVLKKGGCFVVLEFAEPAKTPFRQLYRFYFRRILPLVGRWISGDRTAYAYLPDSVGRFPARGNFLKLMQEAGFVNCRYRNLSLGIACLYVGER